jgi:hypothetical protein
MLEAKRDTATEPTGTRETVTAMLEVTPPAVAPTVVTPGASAATNPTGVIEAIVGSELVHVIARLESTPPSDARNVAANCSDSPK